MRRAPLYLASCLLAAFSCCTARGQGCALTMQPEYSDYISMGVTGTTIYTTVQVLGYTIVHPTAGCNLNGVTHRGKVYNTISTIGGWLYGPSVSPANYINVTNNQSFSGTPGGTYPFSWVAQVDCSMAGTFFHDSVSTGWNEVVGAGSNKNGSNWATWPIQTSAGDTGPLQDFLSGPGLNNSPRPSPTPTYNNPPSGTTMYRQAPQAIRVGNINNPGGLGVLVQTDNLTYWIDHGTHEDIVAPNRPPQ